jgi:hypothetical protein
MTTQTPTVAKNGFVTVDYRYYSIPYKFIGKKIKLMYNRTKVEAYSEHNIIAVHERHFGKEKYIQNDEHLASWHRYPTEWNPEKFIADAALIDPAVVDYIKKVLTRNEYPEKKYRACQGIINYKNRVGDTRLINACKRANSFNVYNFGIIERILKSKTDFIPLEDDEKKAATAIPCPAMIISGEKIIINRKYQSVSFFWGKGVNLRGFFMNSPDIIKIILYSKKNKKFPHQ